jgi:cytochrome b6-f complex iron-sulfur subunit
MATANPTTGAAATAPAKAQTVEVSPVSRREFLYYIWGASIALLLGEATAAIIWFALPRFREGEFGGVIPVALEDLPNAGDAPVSQPAGRFHVSHTPEGGFVVLYGVCTHLGCLPKWEPVNTRFACPCHGSQYQLDGRYITGPAPRGLDRFPVTITLADGSTRTNAEDGWPIDISDIALEDIVRVDVNTGVRVTGPAHGANAQFSGSA